MLTTNRHTRRKSGIEERHQDLKICCCTLLGSSAKDITKGYCGTSDSHPPRNKVPTLCVNKRIALPDEKPNWQSDKYD